MKANKNKKKTKQEMLKEYEFTKIVLSQIIVNNSETLLDTANSPDHYFKLLNRYLVSIEAIKLAANALSRAADKALESALEDGSDNLKLQIRKEGVTYYHLIKSGLKNNNEHESE
jgi:signal recognition particle receptor subunit beta